MNVDRMNVEHAASTMRCAVNTRPSTHLAVAQRSLRELAVSSLARVSCGLLAAAGSRLGGRAARAWAFRAQVATVLLSPAPRPRLLRILAPLAACELQLQSA